jgi:hypothetical protein
MLTELRYQVKIHTISKQPRKEILQILPQIFYLFIYLKQTKHAIWK